MSNGLIMWPGDIQYQVVKSYHDIPGETSAENKLKEDLYEYGIWFRISSMVYDGSKIIVVWEVK